VILVRGACNYFRKVVVPKNGQNQHIYGLGNIKETTKFYDLADPQ